MGVLRSAFTWCAGIVTIAKADGPGDGVSKNTFASTQPLVGLAFMEKYMPVATPDDECSNNVCYCTSDGDWNITQGRVYLKASSTEERRLQGSLGGHAGNGFGLHLVEVAKRATSGTYSIGEVEAQFTQKFSTATYDSFMDFNTGIYATSLDSYIAAFEADSVPMFRATYEHDSKTWYQVYVQVPKSMMILQFLTDTKPVAFSSGHVYAHAAGEVHMTSERAARLSASKKSGELKAVSINRAVTDVAAVAKWYETVMGANTTATYSSANGVTQQCVLYQDATVELCFFNRGDAATVGSFKVSDYEATIAATHKAYLSGQPNCGKDAWLDSHHAYDGAGPRSSTFDASSIVTYVEAHSEQLYYCDKGSLHYLIDPSGWGVQVDLQMHKSPSGCSKTVATDGPFSIEGPSGHSNPACDLGTCTSRTALIV